MTLAHKWKHDRSDRPGDLIFGIVISILLHLIVYLGYDNWLRFKPQQKRSSQPIPIEYVEVPPNPKQTPPPETKRIASNNSVAGGKSLPEQPVAVKSTPSVVREPRGRRAMVQREQGEQRSRGAEEQRSRGENSIQNSEAERRAPLIAKLKSQTTRIAPSIRQPQPKPLSTKIAPNIQKPKPLTRKDLLPPSATSSQSATRTTRSSQPQPKPQTSAKALQEGVTTPSIPPRKPLTRQVLPPKSTSQLATRTTPVLKSSPSTGGTPVVKLRRLSAKTQSQTQPSRTSGAASRLGGSMSVSSRNFQGNYQAALPNSNRFNQSADGIDARRDVDMGSYLMQLQQRVRQQWIPGQTQSSRRTVVHFVVSRSGQVRGLTIARASGSSVTDSAALGAISRAAPFAPLPVGYPHNSINIRFTFNINVSGQLELGVR